MPARFIPYLKAVVHILCALPFVVLFHAFYQAQAHQTGWLATEADPVNAITHFTGDWALWILLADLAITPIRRMSTKLGWLIRFRRMVGLWAFFYATLHLLVYVVLFSGYDVPGAIAGVKAGHVGILWTNLAQIWPAMLGDLEKRWFIQVGFGAWLLLLLLAVTSPQRVLRWMGGKWWSRVHTLVYVAATAAVLHYWLLVKRGVLIPMKVTLVLAVLLLARVVYWAMKKKRSSKTVAA